MKIENWQDSKVNLVNTEELDEIELVGARNISTHECITILKSSTINVGTFCLPIQK